MDVRTLCLSVLSEGPASGYQIKKRLSEEPYRFFLDASFGSIYPALARLAEEHLVEVEAQVQNKRPDKKVYTLTRAGENQLRSSLLLPPTPDRVRSDFLFLLFHGDLMPPALVLQRVDERIASLEAELARMETLIEGCDAASLPPVRSFIRSLGLAYYRDALNFLKSHRPALATQLTPALVAE